MQSGEFYVVVNFGVSDAIEAAMPAANPLLASGLVKPKVMPARTASIWKCGPD